nr:immunoglobulin heavy chain junction region [Mus musculus]
CARITTVVGYTMDYW